MAAVLRIFRHNIPLFSNCVIKNISFNGTVCSAINRFIFTDNSLGLTGYNNSRLQIQQQFASVESSFREKMKEIVENENSVVFTEDLKVMLHLVKKNPEDLDLVLQMMRRFNSQNKELRFGTYVFGPVVMRTLYYLDEPDIALSTFLDSKLTYFFDQSISYTILMTLLYKHKKYNEMRQAYDIIKVRNVDIQRFPTNALIVVMAGCHSENTPESLQYALENWREVHQRGIRPVRRVITFIANLALKQNSPEIALEVLTGLGTSRYIDIRCLKVVAFCHLNRVIDIIPIFRQALEYRTRKDNYFSDVIELVEQTVGNAEESVKNEIMQLISAMKTEGLVEEMTLQEHLNCPIEISFSGAGKQRTEADSRRPFTRSNFSDINRRKRFGLKDLL